MSAIGEGLPNPFGVNSPLPPGASLFSFSKPEGMTPTRKVRIDKITARMVLGGSHHQAYKVLIFGPPTLDSLLWLFLCESLFKHSERIVEEYVSLKLMFHNFRPTHRPWVVFAIPFDHPGFGSARAPKLAGENHATETLETGRSRNRIHRNPLTVVSSPGREDPIRNGLHKRHAGLCRSDLLSLLPPPLFDPSSARLAPRTHHRPLCIFLCNAFSSLQIRPTVI